ncbi:sensor domain-containing protein [Streptomyces sp. YIM 98790]|uniref:sensor histidine kinase n=1 Tax=Streptomyces sp. YIM 98790 TaxID=2689077 RepID=UPI00140A8EB2|nr:sensor domain-containing protein [Streptomyces sp. YIM 98790]
MDEAAQAAGRGLALAALGIVGSVVLFSLTLVSIGLIPVGIGLYTTPWLVDLVRAHAEFRRRLARRWCGITIRSSYRPEPPPVRRGLVAHPVRTADLLRDPATWRDLEWLALDFTVGFTLAVLPPALLAEGVFGVLLALGLWQLITEATGGEYWYAFIPVGDQGTAVLAGLLGLVWLGVVARFGPALVRVHFTATRMLLGISVKQALTRRVERLTETRHDALDTSAAELRRIERDLHDGAQARLVAMGMNLGAVEALIARDPEQARRLVAELRENSAETLSELRDLVRGIHPPVLAERGLGDAVRALALRMPMPVETDVELPRRFEAPVESAAYFAVSEALTNAAKHSGAQRVWLEAGYRAEDRMLRITVTDDGRGGADAGGGSGLAGIERRLGAFDGILAVSSPAGGPTVVTMEIPCTPLR